MPSINLYHRDGCHLCEQVLWELRPHTARLGIRVQEVDITADAALWQRFRYLIPVIETPTRAFFAPIDMEELLQELEEVA